MSENKFERCAEDDPDRCLGITHGQGARQCPYKAVPGVKYCPMHGGTPQIEVNRKAEVMKYRLVQYGERVKDFAQDPEIKNIREEIGILRMTIETVLNECKTPNHLLVYSDKLSGLIAQVNRLIESSQKLEERNNNLLDRKIVILIADNVVALCAKYITDPDALLELGDKLCESIETVASPTYSIGAVA